MEQRKHLSKGIQKFAFLNYAIVSLSVFCLFFTACVSDNGVSSSDKKTLQNTSREFQYNYRLLYYYYVDQDKYLGEPQDYVDKVDMQKMYEKEIPWDYYDLYYMYAMMNDNFTYYVDASRAYSLLNSLRQSDELTGAGFRLDSLAFPDKFIIQKVTKNSPADKAGLKAGDEIVEIEGVAPTNETVFRRLAVATKGETITYTIKRDSTRITIPVVIDSYLSPTVELSFYDSIPVIKISEFVANTSNDSGTYGEFVQYLRETEKYKATIIDLRDNGGGDGDQCKAMTRALLSKGDTAIGIIETKADTIRKRQAFDTTFEINTADGIAKDRYFVFLSNNNTASCSELMIAGVVSNKKYPIVGSVSYGKGIGQTRWITPSFSISSITSMKVIDKDRNSYHKYGIEPDFSIQDNDLVLATAAELAKDMKFKRIAGYGKTNTGHFAKQAVVQDTMPGFYLLPEEYRKKFE